jgi:topoisomerase-4 subunit A
VVLVRRTQDRLGKIERRLEVLDGYLVAYLNLDEVIRIIRFEDEPKQELMRTFKLGDIQAEAILNMRLRALRKLEEMEIRTQNDTLVAERGDLKKLLKSDKAQWSHIASEIKDIRTKFGKKTELGRRRADFGEAPEVEVDIATAMIEKEPVTVVLSGKGWIRAMRGHLDDTSGLQFKEGDALKRARPASTTDTLVLFATNGKFYSLGTDKLPGGRGNGEPVRLMIEMEENHDIVEMFVHQPGRKLLVASSAGYGFIVSEDDVVAMTRKGKQVLNVSEPDKALVCAPADGDMVAAIGENRKMLCFPLKDLNEMSRGRGVRLQRYKDGGMADAKTYSKDEGLTWIDSSSRTWTVTELRDWTGTRAQAGRLPPKGFPKANRFGPKF